MTDADRQAASVIAHYLRGLNMRGADPIVVGNEIIQALRGHGWKPPTTPPPPPAWQQPRTPGTPPPAEWRQARAAIAKDNPLTHLDSEDVTR